MGMEDGAGLDLVVSYIYSFGLIFVFLLCHEV